VAPRHALQLLNQIVVKLFERVAVNLLKMMAVIGNICRIEVPIDVRHVSELALVV